jgi:NAD(P)H-flavin reductase
VGVVPNILKEVSPSPDKSYTIVCGPSIMIRFTLAALEELKFKKDKIYTSLEMRMKCAVGKCGRCNIGPKYICKDGPIFSMDQLDNFASEI